MSYRFCEEDETQSWVVGDLVDPLPFTPNPDRPQRVQGIAGAEAAAHTGLNTTNEAPLQWAVDLIRDQLPLGCPWLAHHVRELNELLDELERRRTN